MNKKNRKSIDEMFEEISEIIKFIVEHNDDNTVFAEFASITNEAYGAKNLRGMRYIYKDTYEWASYLPESQIDQLNETLSSKLNTRVKQSRQY